MAVLGLSGWRAMLSKKVSNTEDIESDEGRETIEDELDLPSRLGGTGAASSGERRGRFGEYGVG
jgi:hypothetical protein